MKKIIIVIFLLVLIMCGYTFVRRLSSSISIEYVSSIEKNNHSLAHEDSIREFIDWYDAMVDTFLSLSDIEDYKKIGPEKMLELESRFSNWHVKLTDIDKNNIKYSFKKCISKIVRHSMHLIEENDMQIEPLSEEQINYMIYHGQHYTDLLLDTTTYLDYFILWAKENYIPSIGK